MEDKNRQYWIVSRGHSFQRKNKGKSEWFRKTM